MRVREPCACACACAYACARACTCTCTRAYACACACRRPAYSSGPIQNQTPTTVPTLHPHRAVETRHGSPSRTLQRKILPRVYYCASGKLGSVRVCACVCACVCVRVCVPWLRAMLRVGSSRSSSLMEVVMCVREPYLLTHPSCARRHGWCGRWRQSERGGRSECRRSRRGAVPRASNFRTTYTSPRRRRASADSDCENHLPSGRYTCVHTREHAPANTR